MGEARQLPDVPAVAHIPDHVTRVVYVQGLEVVVDGVAHNHLALQHTENLEERHKRTVRNVALCTSVNSCLFSKGHQWNREKEKQSDD